MNFDGMAFSNVPKSIQSLFIITKWFREVFWFCSGQIFCPCAYYNITLFATIRIFAVLPASQNFSQNLDGICYSNVLGVFENCLELPCYVTATHWPSSSQVSPKSCERDMISSLVCHKSQSSLQVRGGAYFGLDSCMRDSDCCCPMLANWIQSKFHNQDPHFHFPL